MSADRVGARPARSASLRRRVVLSWRRGRGPERKTAAVLSLFAVAIATLVWVEPDATPFTSLMLPLLLGSIFLGPRTLPWFVILVMALLTFSVSQQVDISGRTIGATSVQFVMGLVVLVASFRRSRLGVAGAQGESMLVDLRDRILTQGGLPEIPANWSIQSALYSAGGTAFSGDFVVATRSTTGNRIEVVVVDVSGKGEEAGTRALLLSGAFGGLLGAMRSENFLPAANDYLLRQSWAEGFATAIHLTLDLDSGDFEIRTAGHPPAAHRAAGSGRWSVLRSEGPVLGLIEDAEFHGVSGRIAPGDAVLLYTDGMVEEPRRDIDLGIDRMLGEAESMLRGSFDGAADRLARSLGSPSDDRAMMVVHRR